MSEVFDLVSRSGLGTKPGRENFKSGLLVVEAV